MARTLYDDLFDDLAEMTYDGFIRGHEKQSEITQLMHENEVLRVEREKYYTLYRSWQRRARELETKLAKVKAYAE